MIWASTSPKPPPITAFEKSVVEPSNLTAALDVVALARLEEVVGDVLLGVGDCDSEVAVADEVAAA